MTSNIIGGLDSFVQKNNNDKLMIFALGGVGEIGKTCMSFNMELTL